MKKLAHGVVVVTALLTACSGGNGKYIGKWVNINSTQRTLQIDRNGDTFIIRNTEPSFITGQAETKNFPAIIKDGTLQAQMGGLVPVTLVIDQKTGNLTNGQAEYVKAK